MLFNDGMFAPDGAFDARTAGVLIAATDRAAGLVDLGDILRAAIDGDPSRVEVVLAGALADGVTLADLGQIVDVTCPPRAGDLLFDGRRERFTAAALAALDRYDSDVAADPARLGPVGLEILLGHVLAHLDEAGRRDLEVLDVPRAVRQLREAADSVAAPPAPLIEDASGRLRSEEFTEAARAVLDGAAAHAGDLGYRQILPPHCLLALLGESEGLTERLVRLQVAPEVGLARVVTAVTEAFRLGVQRREAPALDATGISGALMATLRSAQRIARDWGSPQVDAAHLLGALLDDPPARLAAVLTGHPLDIDLGTLRQHLDEALRDRLTRPEAPAPFQFAAGLPPHEDLTWRARTEGPVLALHVDRHREAAVRALHRSSHNHVLITAAPGVGSTTLLMDLAGRAAAGDGALQFLARKRFIRFDCGEVLAHESGAVLAAIVTQVAARTDVVVCVDGLGPLLRGESGARHNVLLRRALKERRLQLVATIDSHDYEDLVSADHALAAYFTRVDLAEPDLPAATAIAHRDAAAIGAGFGLHVQPEAVERAVVLARDYLLNERFPRKVATVLRRACEDVDYRRRQLHEPATAVTERDVIAVIAAKTDIPEGQLSGTGSGGVDFEQVLGERVQGQDAAVRAVAAQLYRIEAGLNDPGKPASVLFFAGLTGVGKTELAKAVAGLYSASRRLQTYPMGNFTEAHSVSGITGVPPGYVGYEYGGRLVNDLNADPYCVFLLDEAEKAHPDIWKPFLNLFDEGWTVDMRNVKAFADRSIFILTSNAGADEIAAMTAAGRPVEDIADAVRLALPKLEHKSGQKIFPPEFLARINQIIVFRPLDLAAMDGITRRAVAQKETFWREKRSRRLVVPEALIQHVAGRAHTMNTHSGGAQGGRVVRKLLSEAIDDVIALQARSQPERFRDCTTVELTLTGGATSVAFTSGTFTGTSTSGTGADG